MNSFTNFFKDKNLQVGVLSSVIASFIFINIQNIFASLWSLFTKFSENIYSNFSDSVYSNASLGQRNWLDFLVFFLIINGMVLFVVRESFYLKLKTNRLLKKEKTNVKESNDTNSEEKVKLERKSAFDLLKFINRIILPILLFSVLMQIIITISYVFLSYADLQLNTSFKSKIGNFHCLIKV
jgi:hypothetical protein